jgi:predicted amidohydrolase YtcJ
MSLRASRDKDRKTFFHNARFYNLDNPNNPVADGAMLVSADGVIDSVMSAGEYTDTLESLQDEGVNLVDLGGRTVLPGFIDGHMHLLMMGMSIQKLPLDDCENLTEIRQSIKSYALHHPNVPRILCSGWMHSMTDGQTNATDLDDLDSRPIFIDAKDLHSVWCNTSALEEMGIREMETPAGGVIARDEAGNPTGLVGEAAVLTVVWPHLSRIASMEEKKKALLEAILAFNAAGYTGVVDMAMDENQWEALLALRESHPNLTMRISAYWIITPSANEADHMTQVDRAIALSRQFNSKTSPDCRILGIKVITDGIIDGCTAALTKPYSNGIDPDPIWSREMLAPVVDRAASAGLQCAIHAIGDLSIKLAIDVLEPHCHHRHNPGGHRHRIEHLELCSDADSLRLGNLAIIASIQPVHSDPAILRAWPRLIGSQRTVRAFAYREFADHGAPLALGSDAPTAPHGPLQNVYVATTRRSARAPAAGDAPVNPHFALGLCEALAAGTAGAAFSSCSEERVGRFRPGLMADFVVCDMVWEKEKMLEAKVVETWFAGEKVFSVS